MEASKALIIKKKLTDIQYIILYFFLYSFIGWLMETFYSLLVLGHFTNRGFLVGPICPIYGFGAILMILFISKYKKNSIKLFLASAFIFSAFEYVVGFALDAIFAAKWWDYTYDFFNLNGRISILYTIAWGFIGLLFINHIHPFFSKKIEKSLSAIPTYILKVLIYLMPIILIIDTIFSSLKYLGIL